MMPDSGPVSVLSRQRCRDNSWLGLGSLDNLPEEELEKFFDQVSERNVLHTVKQILGRSDAIRDAVAGGRVKVVGAIYDVKTGEIEFLETGESSPLDEMQQVSAVA